MNITADLCYLLLTVSAALILFIILLCIVYDIGFRQGRVRWLRDRTHQEKDLMEQARLRQARRSRV